MLTRFDTPLIFLRRLDTVGDDSGDGSGVGDFSVTPRELKIAPPSNRRFYITRIIVTIEDVGTLDADSYGNGVALTNGITIEYRRGGATITDFTANQPVKKNVDWGTLCYDVEDKVWGQGNEFIVARMTFSRFGHPITLNGAESDELVVTLSDDFSGLVSHKFVVSGWQAPNFPEDYVS